MVAWSFHLPCLVFIFILIQSVSLYKIHASDNHHSENMVVNDDDSADQWQFRSDRSLPGMRIQNLPQRRNNRPHWNPLVAAYKRCGEFLSREERETCFKDAIQMLFVYKL